MNESSEAGAKARIAKICTEGSTPSIPTNILFITIDMKVLEFLQKATRSAGKSGRARMAALHVGESVVLRGMKLTSVRVTAATLGRDLGRVYSVSGAKGKDITVSRTK